METQDLEKAIYMWFDMKYELYSRLDHNDSIYLYYSDSKTADILIGGWCIVYDYDFWVEFRDVFFNDRDVFAKCLSNWVELKFGRYISNIYEGVNYVPK